MTEWKPTACILCECNCGIEVQLGGDDGRSLVRIRGDKAHPASKGYACEKPQRLDHYQNGRERVTEPLRRRPDGTFEPISWEDAIREVSEKLAAVRDAHGGETIFYYGGGGQGNHLPGAYSRSTLKALGSVYRSNALAQEKTGEFWVSGKMIGSGVRADFENCEIAIFLGKNPWHSHGIARARITLKEIAKDPNRKLVVIDPRRSETADLADLHLQVEPGTDAWLLAALIATLVQEGLLAGDWLAGHTTGLEEIVPLFEGVSVAAYAKVCGIDESTIRELARAMARARSVAVFEDLGVQMNRHSTLVSYLNRLTWLLTGHFAKSGCAYIPASLQPIGRDNDRGRQSPVVGAKIISGLVPCNVIADEVLSEHASRYRAMIVESANPAHSLADSQHMRQALESLECLVVIDVAMTETARLADYVLPTATQFEKGEATFFNFEFPHNYFHFRRPILAAPEGVLPEPEIHARLVEALGAMPVDLIEQLRAALKEGRDAFRAALFAASGSPSFTAFAPVILYRTLGEELGPEKASAAVLYALAGLYAMQSADSLRRAGFEGETHELGDRLFDAIVDGAHGVVFAVDEWDEVWKRVGTADGRIHLAIAELFDQVRSLESDLPAPRDAQFPFVLSAGERRSFTANTIVRSPEWRKKDAEGALRISPGDAERLGLTSGGRARVVTKRGSAEVQVEVTDRMRQGHVSLPNGMGIGDAPQKPALGGIAPNELTASGDRDFLAGTPWHKAVPARVEAL